jgi:hypothetical protein
LTEFEKSSGFRSVFGSFAGVPDGDASELRFGGILTDAPDVAVLLMEEAVGYCTGGYERLMGRVSLVTSTKELENWAN